MGTAANCSAQCAHAATHMRIVAAFCSAQYAHTTIQPRIPRFRGPPTRSHFVGAIRCAPYPSAKNCRTLPKAALLGSSLNDTVRWHLPSVPLNGCFATALMKVDSAEPTFRKHVGSERSSRFGEYIVRTALFGLLHSSAQSGRTFTKGSSVRSQARFSANGAPAAAGLFMDFDLI